MTATTAAPTRASSFFPHRYTNPMISSPRSGESSQSNNFLSTSPFTNARATATPRMTLAVSSKASNGPDDIAAMLPSRRSHQGDDPADPSSSGVKYACASCIRGHRTSSCTHKDGSKGPLYPIRSKGRPPTQCEVCRKKRKESGRHVRCDCTGKKAPPAAPSSHPLKRVSSTGSNAPILPNTASVAPAHEAVDRLDDSRPLKKTKILVDPKATQLAPVSSMRRVSDAESSDDATSRTSTFDNVLAPIRPPRGHHSWSLPSIHSAHEISHGSDGRDPSLQTAEELVPRRYSTLSLSSLMNPCGCRSTGACSCCSEHRQHRLPMSPKQRDSNLDDCDLSRCSCSSSSCRQSKRAQPDQSHVKSAKVATSSCCSSKGASASKAPSIELLLQAVDMSTEFVPPPCGCGKNCRCARCLAKQGTNASMSDPQQHVENPAPSAISASPASPTTPPAAMAMKSVPAIIAGVPGCDDCAACDLALERPSGIGVVDSWMEKHHQPTRPSYSLSSPPRSRSTSVESSNHDSNTVSNAITSRRTSQSEDGTPLDRQTKRRESVSISSSVPTLHGGLLTSEPGNRASRYGQDSSPEDEEVRAELVLVHPNCAACLEVVKRKGVGVLSSAPVSAK